MVEALWALDPPPTAQELADALWLAARIQEAEGNAAPPAQEAPRPRVPADTPGPRPAGGAGPSQGHRAAAAGRDPAPQAGLYVTGREPGRAFPVRSPGVAAISHSLPLVRAMRPLRVSAPSPARTYLDEAHTAQSVADTGVWVPVMRPSPERWLEMSLVVDTGRSMVIWQRTVEELRVLLQQLGAFRDVRVWRLDTDAERLRLRTDTAPGGESPGQGRSPDELIDPTRRRVVLVVTDCLGGAWRDGRAAALLERWGRAGPVAIVQPLPQRLWSRCAAALEPVRFSTAIRAAPNDRLTVVPTTAPLLSENGGPNGTAADPGIAVPVMELEPRWVRTWAGFVAAGGRDMPGVALFTGRAVAPLAEDPGGADPSPMERVMRFRAASSPEAFQLARHLAAAPLNLEVMRLVQRAMLPRSTPAHLAEVYLGDLMRTAGSQGGTVTDDLRKDVAASRSDGSGGTVSYDFREGVRDVLLSGMLRGDALRVLTEVWHVVKQQLGSTHDFPALLGAIRRGEEPLPPDQPFAQVAVQVLARLGGRYKEVAERLGAASAESGADGATRPGTAPGPGAGRAAGTPIWGGVPPRDPGFVGRDTLLAATREALDDGPVALVPASGHRLGGEGTSRLAAEYAHRYAGEYDLVWWIPAAQATDAWASLAALAERLDAGGAGLGTAAQALRALGAGAVAGRWLLVYDDAADPPGLGPLMPPATSGASTGHVLVTGGDAAALADGHTVIRVGRLDRADSVALLRARAPGLTTGQADLLARDLDDHPSALRLAAAWLEAARRSSGEDVRDYLRLLDLRARTLGEGRPPMPPKVAAAAELALTRLGAERPVAGRLLELWTYLGSHPVSARMLSAGPLADLAPALAHEDTLRDAMRDIDRYALGRFDPDAEVLRVHPQVRAMLRLRAAPRAGHPQADHSPVRACVDAVLSAATPAEEPENSATWEARAEITPHLVPAEAVLGTARHVVLDQVRYLLARGDADGGRRLAESAAGAWPDLHGPDDELLLEVGRWLADALRMLGDHRAAAGLGADLLPRMRSRFGPDHPGTLSAARGAGADLRFHGRFREAYELDDDTWRRTLRRFGADDARSLLAAADVATDLRLLGDVHHAHALDSDAHARLRRRLGPRHRDVVRVAGGLSRDLHELGRYGEALAVQRECLADARSAPPAPHVLPLLVTHAGTLRASGEPAEAHGVARETLDDVRQQFGADHPHTLAAEVCLALAEISVGVLGQACDRLREARTAYRRVLGDGHPFTHVCAAGYGAALRAAGDAQTALGIDEAARAGLGGDPDHHHALCCAAGVAADLYLLGELESAAALSADTAAGLQRRLGPAHPHTLAAAHNHRVITQNPGAQSAADLRTVLGDRHPDVAAAAAGELLELHIEPLLLE
ncbi:FxSxx-COOH system tetratricopeptide repeat protein [Spirillospora sp. NPDC048819]|uniref:FxSxx-COOH system tetratricopeptide repeat protein n=1 Tax=Spirillospora sp. NPDC048819 TaxID=3155268 RepID=UPI0033EB6E73